MDEVFIAAKFAGVMFALYAIIAAVETGVGFFKLFPHLLKSQGHLRHAFAPVWKTSTVFLLLGIGSMMVFFGDANEIFIYEFKSLAIAIGGLLLIRWLLYIYLFFRSNKRHSSFVYALYLLLCLSVPVLLSLGAAYLMSGERWISALSITLASITLSSILLGITTFMLRDPQEATNRKLISLAATALFATLILTGVVLPWVAMSYAGQLYDNPAFSLVFLVVGIIGGLWLWMMRCNHFHHAWALSIACSAGIFSVLFLSHWPYLFYPHIALDMVYTGKSVLHTLASGTAAALVVGGPGLYWIYRLMQNSRKGY